MLSKNPSILSIIEQKGVLSRTVLSENGDAFHNGPPSLIDDNYYYQMWKGINSIVVPPEPTCEDGQGTRSDQLPVFSTRTDSRHDMKYAPPYMNAERKRAFRKYLLSSEER